MRLTVRGERHGTRFLVSSNMEFQLSPTAVDALGAGEADSSDNEQR